MFMSVFYDFFIVSAIDAKQLLKVLAVFTGRYFFGTFTGLQIAAGN